MVEAEIAYEIMHIEINAVFLLLYQVLRRWRK